MYFFGSNLLKGTTSSIFQKLSISTYGNFLFLGHVISKLDDISKYEFFITIWSERKTIPSEFSRQIIEPPILLRLKSSSIKSSDFNLRFCDSRLILPPV